MRILLQCCLWITSMHSMLCTACTHTTSCCPLHTQTQRANVLAAEESSAAGTARRINRLAMNCVADEEQHMHVSGAEQATTVDCECGAPGDSAIRHRQRQWPPQWASGSSSGGGGNGRSSSRGGFGDDGRTGGGGKESNDIKVTRRGDTKSG